MIYVKTFEGSSKGNYDHFELIHLTIETEIKLELVYMDNGDKTSVPVLLIKAFCLYSDNTECVRWIDTRKLYEDVKNRYFQELEPVKDLVIDEDARRKIMMELRERKKTAIPI